MSEPNILDANLVGGMREYAFNTVKWVQDFVGITPDPWQCEALQAYHSPMVDGVPAKGYAVAGCTGAGKSVHGCTPIIMYDGTVRLAQDVVEGDLLMGPDSRPRRVLTTHSDTSAMYRITPTKGDPFVCNDVHILSLKMTGKNTWRSGEVVNISVEDYLQKGVGFKHRAKLWRTGVDFDETDKVLPVPSYILGVWLGDGTLAGPHFTTEDPEILHALMYYAESVDLNVTHKAKAGRADTWSLSRRNGTPGENHLYGALRSLGITEEKRIPRTYLTASRKERMELLAGLLDTDGYLAHGYFEISQKSSVLASDILFLARSLGFAAYAKRERKQCTNNGVWGEYSRISISGNVDQIPTRIPRKQATARQQKKDVLLTGFKVEPVGEGRYYGWELDGDGLFLLGDFTVTHNTTMIALAVLHFLSTRPFPKIACSSAKMEQLTTGLWPELHKWIRHSKALDAFLQWTPTKVYFRHATAKDEWMAFQRVARARTSAGGEKRSEGLAGIHSDHLLMVLDEASGIDAENFDAAEGCCTGFDNHMLVTGNPLRSGGRFHDIFHNPNLMRNYQRKNVSYLEAPRVDRAQAEQMIRMYGINSPTVQARVFGLFPTRSSVDTCMTIDAVREAMTREVQVAEDDMVQIGVDVARFGDDDTCYVVRKGRKVVKMQVESQRDAVQVAAAIHELAKKFAVPDEATNEPWFQVPIVIDETGGYGGGPIDILKTYGYERIIGINYGSAAFDGDLFANRVSEMWIQEFPDILDQISIPDDEELFMQLTSRRFSYKDGSVARKIIEKKPDLKKRGMSSPDRADAVIQAFIDVDRMDAYSNITFW